MIVLFLRASSLAHKSLCTKYAEKSLSRNIHFYRGEIPVVHIVSDILFKDNHNNYYLFLRTVDPQGIMFPDGYQISP